MERTAKVSILIPAYNVEQYVDQCLESVVNQTLQEIEIIVVDDCSTDSTLEHIKVFAAQDERILVIPLRENIGVFQCRKVGISHAHGEYILFADADDYLEPNACETAYTKAKETGAEILHFGTFVEKCCDIPQSTVDRIQQYYSAYLTASGEKSLVKTCFVYRQTDWNLWNRLYRSDLVRAVYPKLEDRRSDYYEDIYLNFYLFLRGKKQEAIEEKLYHYCYGRGMSPIGTITLSKFRMICQGYEVVRGTTSFAKRLKSGEETADWTELAEDAVMAAEYIQDIILNGVLNAWQNSLEKIDQPEAIRILKSAWLDEYALVNLLAQKIGKLQTQNNQASKRVWELEQGLKSKNQELVSKNQELASRNQELASKKRELASTEKELEMIKGTVSFRLGRTATWVPRKIRGGVRCYKEHGAKYTGKRILYHLHLGPDNEKRCK